MGTTREKLASNISAGVAVVLFLGATVFLTFEMSKNRDLQESIKKELLAKESLLSEKLAVAKELAIAKANYKDLREKNYSQEASINILRSKLDDANHELDRLTSQRASTSQLNQQKKKLEELKKELDEKERVHHQSVANLQKLNDDLNLMVTMLEQQNNTLRAELDASRLSEMDEIRIESSKKNNKITVFAKRTKKLMANFDVPSTTTNLNCKIISPSGKELTDASGTISINTLPHGPSLQTSTAQNGFLSEITYERVVVTYVPKQKLTAGIYTIKVLSGTAPVGSLQAKLR